MKIAKDSQQEFVICSLNQNVITVCIRLSNMEAQIVFALETAWAWCCLCYTLDEGKQSVSHVYIESQRNIAEDGIYWNAKDYI